VKDNEASEAEAAIEAAETLEEFHDLLGLGAEGEEDEEHAEPLDHEEGEIELKDGGPLVVDVDVILALGSIIVLRI
jgi:hypothetical protein